MNATVAEASPLKDEAAMASDATFETFRHDVYAWAYRLLGSHHDALDVAQDVYLKWSRQVAEALPAHPRGWLRRVTVNRAIDLARMRRESSSGVEHAAVPDTIRAASIEREELRLQVAIALARLSDLQRCVVVAKIHDEHTFRQIARDHGLAVPTVKTHYVRGLEKLRHALDV